MKGPRYLLFFAVLFGCFASGWAQTLWSPGAAIGNNTANSNVGVGTNTPGEKLTIAGGGLLLDDHPAVTVNSEMSVSIRITAPGGWARGYGILNSLNQSQVIWGALGSGNDLAYAYIGQTYSSPWLVVRPSGNVGIGTTSPSARLTIADENNSFPLMVVGNGQILGVALGTDGAGVPSINGFKSDFATAANLALQTYGGNVGIGTSNPRSRLDVGGHVGAQNGVRIGDYLELNEREDVNNASSIGWNAVIASDDGTYTPTWATGSGMVLSMSGGGTADLDFWGRSWGGSAAPVQLNAFTHVMRLGTNGNVGIGTTSPTHKLSVNGTVKTREVIVEAVGWSDYVFAPDYELAPLSEVEAHIKEHQHLPGIPSALEVAEQGVSVGEMQAKLLAKIEELTLHVIAQEKRAETQAAEIAALRAQVAKLAR